MNRFLQFLTALVVAVAATTASVPAAAEAGLEHGPHCMWDGHAPRSRGVSDYQEAHPDALMAVDWITRMVGLEPNFEVLSASFTRGGGAFATIHKGQRYIVFDRAYTSWGDGETDWHAIGVAGHEIGHHLASHVFTDESGNHAEELEADAFAGFAMGYLGATRNQALSLFPGSRPASVSHPADADRRVAIARGWERGVQRRGSSDAVCEAAWAGDRFYIEGLPCRMAQVCTDAGSRPRLACRSEAGDWIWQE